MCEATRFHDNRQMKVVRISTLRNCNIYTPGDIPVTHFLYRLRGPMGHNVAFLTPHMTVRLLQYLVINGKTATVSGQMYTHTHTQTHTHIYILYIYIHIYTFIYTYVYSSCHSSHRTWQSGCRRFSLVMSNQQQFHVKWSWKLHLCLSCYLGDTCTKNQISYVIFDKNLSNKPVHTLQSSKQANLNVPIISILQNIAHPVHLNRRCLLFRPSYI